MLFRPHAYQQHCIDRIIEIKKIGLFLDMGLGKTVITLTAIRELMYNRFEVRRVLVIAPKKVAEGTWTKEKDKWEHTKILRVSPVLGSQAKRIRALNTPADIYIINRENVSWLVDYYRNSWPFDMVVIDESSSFKSHKAKRFKSLASIGNHIVRLVELTGTPSPNGLNDLWSQVFLLDGGERLGKRYTQFRERYFDPGDRGNNIVYNYKAKPGSEDSILAKISDICVSMKAEDYLQLPDIIYHQVPVILDAKAEKAYRELERKMVLELPEDETDISVTSAAALSNKLLQLANGALYDDDHEAITKGCLSAIEQGAEIVLCTGGMSVDPDDKTPLAIKNTGARIVSYGAPVLPGAMFLVSYYEYEDKTIPIVGLPGCVMYAKRTIFDLALPRLLANDFITAEELALLGEGGLCLNCPVCTYPNCGFGKGW